jgi:hypothetical protein
MRILITVAHYYHPEEKGKYASQQANAAPRLTALRNALTYLTVGFSGRQLMLDIANRTTIPANGVAHEIDIVVCTTKGRHLLDQLKLPNGIYRHRPSDAEPMFLGYECHQVLRDHVGLYDVYGFMEDDIVVADSDFFNKLAWFQGLAGPECLLQPQRYEVTLAAVGHKVFIDGLMRERATERFQNRLDRPEIRASVYGREVVFMRPNNPHSGCFFLSAAQMRHWAAQPYFLDRSKEFIGPLESAATLGIMRAFRIYKPALENAGFFEVQHHGTRYHNLIGSVFTTPEGRPAA